MKWDCMTDVHDIRYFFTQFRLGTHRLLPMSAANIISDMLSHLGRKISRRQLEVSQFWRQLELAQLYRPQEPCKLLRPHGLLTSPVFFPTRFFSSSRSSGNNEDSDQNSKHRNKFQQTNPTSSSSEKVI